MTEWNIFLILNYFTSRTVVHRHERECREKQRSSYHFSRNGIVKFQESIIYTKVFFLFYDRYTGNQHFIASLARCRTVLKFYVFPKRTKVVVPVCNLGHCYGTLKHNCNVQCKLNLNYLKSQPFLCTNLSSTKLNLFLGNSIRGQCLSC